MHLEQTGPGPGGAQRYKENTGKTKEEGSKMGKMFNESDVQTGISEGIKAHGMPEMVRRTNLTAESLARIAAGANVRQNTLLAAAIGLGLVLTSSAPVAINLTPLPQA